ncbi:hypothetical protein ACE6H2_027556 [Prunus campanulata]
MIFHCNHFEPTCKPFLSFNQLQFLVLARKTRIYLSKELMSSNLDVFFMLSLGRDITFQREKKKKKK